MTILDPNADSDGETSSPSEAEKIAALIKTGLPSLKVGTLRFWGEWFGRPYDNWHRVTVCDVEGRLPRIHFNEGELLQVWSPSLVTVDQAAFTIQNAERVRWEWFYYGRMRMEENRYFMDFQRLGDAVAASTNVDWFMPDLHPSLRAPAVEIVYVAGGY